MTTACREQVLTPASFTECYTTVQKVCLEKTYMSSREDGTKLVHSSAKLVHIIESGSQICLGASQEPNNSSCKVKKKKQNKTLSYSKEAKMFLALRSWNFFSWISGSRPVRCNKSGLFSGRAVNTAEVLTRPFCPLSLSTSPGMSHTGKRDPRPGEQHSPGIWFQLGDLIRG